jgi:hypothetical protein
VKEDNAARLFIIIIGVILLALWFFVIAPMIARAAQPDSILTIRYYHKGDNIITNTRREIAVVDTFKTFHLYYAKSIKIDTTKEGKSN